MQLKRIEEVIATKTPYYISEHGEVFKGSLDNLVPVSLIVHNQVYELKIQYENLKNKVQILFVHKLVALYFVDNPNGYKHTLHKDGNKLNNFSENLMWYHHNRLPGTNKPIRRDGSQTRLKKKGPPIELLPGEIWKPHHNLKNVKVSNKGRVCHGNHLYYQKGTNETYKSVCIRKKNYKVHRLILETFVPNLNSNLLEVNHINGIKSDNELTNLQWVTKSQNSKDKNERQKNKGKVDWIQEYRKRSNISEEEFVNQEWRQIPVKGFEAFYVSNLGLVKKIGTIKKRFIEKYVSPTLMSSSNYFESRLTIGNRKHGKIPYQELRRGLHSFVALAWIPNPNNKNSVNHKDGNTYNNRLENLEWATTVEQNTHFKALKR